MPQNGVTTLRTEHIATSVFVSLGLAMSLALTGYVGLELVRTKELSAAKLFHLAMVGLAIAAAPHVLYRMILRTMELMSRIGLLAEASSRYWFSLQRKERNVTGRCGSALRVAREVLCSGRTAVCRCLKGGGKVAGFADVLARLLRTGVGTVRSLAHFAAIQFRVWANLGLRPASEICSRGAWVSALKRNGEPRTELAAALHAWRGAFIGIGLFSALINVLMLTGAVFMLEVYDRVLPSRSVPTLLGIALLATLLYIGMAFLEFIRSRMLVRIGSAVEVSLTGRVFSAVMRLPLLMGNRGDGTLPVRDLETIRGFVSGPGPTAFFDLPWVPLYMLIIFAFHPLLGLTALLGAVVLFALTLLAERRTRDALGTAASASAARRNLTEASRRNSEVIAALGMAGRMEANWSNANAKYMAGQQQASDVAGGFGAFSKSLRLMLQSAVLGVGAYLVIHSQASAGIIIAASILSGRALAPVDLAIAQWKGFVAARQSWSRLNELLAGLPIRINSVSLPQPSLNFGMQNASVCAPGERKLILSGVSFAVEAGHGLGIIGPSGSGKSTLVRAVVGAWPLVSGRVRLDGADLDQWNAEELGRHFGYLPQDVELLQGTIAENIARFEPNPSSENVVKAARAAGVHDLIVNLREGYDTDIGEHGEVLSAGQRQRIALARALYGDPFLVVLDEPNSNLDYEGEMALTEAIVGVRERGGIVIIVAHRPGALSAVDQILALNEGRVQAFGPKEEVFAKLFPTLQAVSSVSARHKIAGKSDSRIAVDAGS